MLYFIWMGFAEVFGTDRARKIQIENIYLCRVWNPRHSITGESAPYTARPRCLCEDLWFNVLQDSGIQIYNTITWQHLSNWLWLYVYLNWLSDAIAIYISYLHVDFSWYNNSLQNFALAIKTSKHNRFHTCICFHKSGYWKTINTPLDIKSTGRSNL